MDLYEPILTDGDQVDQNTIKTRRLRPVYKKTPLKRTDTAYVLEDDEASGLVATEFLKGYGFKTVVWRRSLVQAMKDAPALARGEYDLVLLDMMLPDGTAVSLMDKIKDEGCPSPVGFYTGRAALEGADFYDQHACDFIFEKPLMADAFVDTLDDLKRAAKT
jgi:DNA-binding NtrC family response regulator